MKKKTLGWGILLFIISLTTLVFSQGTYVVPGGNLSGSFGAWGGTAHFYNPTFNVDAPGGIDIIYYDIDLSQLVFGNDWQLKGYAEPGISASNGWNLIDPLANSVWGVFHNQEVAAGTDWNNIAISTLGPDGLPNTSDDTRHGAVQDWYRASTGGKVNGPGGDIAHNNESYVTPNPRYPSAAPMTASELNKYDFRLRILPTGPNTYTYEMWTRMHNAASNYEGCTYCNCGVWNHAMNNCPDAWRSFTNGGNTVFSISGFDLSSVYVFMGLGNGNIASSQALTWGKIEITGTPTSIPTSVWVDDDYYAGGINDGHTWGYDAFAKIQDAINGVETGGTVNVAAGTYNYVNQGSPPPSGLIKVTNGVTIKAVDGTRPIIDGSGFDGVFKIHPSALIPGNVVIIEGFDITGDATTGIAITMQGCFDVVPANVIIRDNWIHGMVGGIDFWGAGFYLPPGWTSALAKVEITNNKFYDLVISGSDQGFGVMIEDPANWLSAGDDYAVKIENNEFSNIPSNGANPGVGIVIPRADDPWEAANVYIAGNSFTTVPIGIAVMDGDVTTAQIVNNSFVSNAVLAVLAQNIDNSPLDAELNWWGTAVESEIQAKISGDIDYDPWIGKVYNLLNTVYDFPGAGVKMEFSTLPTGGGTVTVARYNEAYTPFPVGYSNVALWLDITSSMPNYSFNVTVYVDVFGISGFDETTTVMYRTTGGTWLAVPGGTYLASDPLFGGHPSFSFTTNHFTPFTFINTPADAFNVYLSSGTSAAAGFIYPNTDWGITGYEPPLGDDWDFTAPISLYIVPEVGSEFGASDITIQWDNTMYSYSGVDPIGGIYDNPAYQFFYNQLGTTNSVTINASRTDNNNFTIGTGNYIAKLNLNLLKPGFAPINFTALDFRAFDGLGGQLGVFMTGNNGQVKSYLGDVASHTSTLTGDGLIDFFDLSPWSISYWSGVGGFGMANYKVKYDVGPTSTNNVYGIPAVDGKIQFEDLVIFSMSYGFSASNVYPKIKAEPTAPVDLQLGEPMIAGNQTRIPLFVSGGVQNVRAMSLTFAGEFGRFVSVEKGSLLAEFTNPVMVMSNVDGSQIFVDLALCGAEELGINTEGEVLTLVFEGNTEINISSADVRNILNGTMSVNISGTEGLVPAEFALMQNYPNPFNPTTTINYNLPKQAMVEVSIFNALGERVAMLVNEVKEAGRHTVEFNASGYSSGIYFYQIKANDFVSVKKMILMK